MPAGRLARPCSSGTNSWATRARLALPIRNKDRCWGPRSREEEIRKLLDGLGAKYRLIESEEELCRHVAELIAAKKVVGWFQGRMEFGPRALAAGAFSAMPAAPRCRP